MVLNAKRAKKSRRNAKLFYLIFISILCSKRGGLYALQSTVNFSLNRKTGNVAKFTTSPRLSEVGSFKNPETRGSGN